MPNRVIKESIKRSSEIDSLTWFQEVCFYRLMTTVDDDGRYYANPQILRSDLFPLKEDMTKAAIVEALNKFENVGLIKRYEVAGKEYLVLTTWEIHQRVRNKVHHFPGPLEADTGCGNSRQSAASCGELPQSAADCGPTCARAESNPIQSESNPNPNPIICSEPCEVSEPVEAEKAVFEIMLNDKTLYGITQSMIDQYKELYPAVDVEQEIRNMIGWTDSNPKKRKTKTGIKRFINGWLERKQNRGGTSMAAGNQAIDFTQYATGG